MKIHIPALYRTKNVGGKEFFCKRLAREFRNMGHKIIESESEKHDINLLAGLTKNKSKTKTIFRADGVYNNTEIFYSFLNSKIKKTINFSNAVIYQSEFSKIMCNQYLGKAKRPSTIIFNGFDPLDYKDINAFNSKYKYNFLTSSKWRPHKRLRDIIKCFKLANIKDSCLYVAGDLTNSGIPHGKMKEYVAKSKNIIFLDNVENKKLLSYIKMCDCFIHLCWMESCPNGVVEAIAAGKPVITNNVGGTKEIVEPSGGIICKIDKKYDLKPCRLYKPPKFNYKIISDAMKYVISNKIDIKNDHLDIKNIAKQYIAFFRKVLRG